MIQSSLCSRPSTLGINQFVSINLNKILFIKQTIVCVCIYDLWCECMNVYKGLCEIWHVCMVEDSSHDMMTVVGESSCPCALEQDVKQQMAPEAVFWCVNVSSWASERVSDRRRGSISLTNFIHRFFCFCWRTEAALTCQSQLVSVCLAECVRRLLGR